VGMPPSAAWSQQSIARACSHAGVFFELSFPPSANVAIPERWPGLARLLYVTLVIPNFHNTRTVSIEELLPAESPKSYVRGRKVICAGTDLVPKADGIRLMMAVLLP
jgi:hypothetical protein